MIEIREQVSCPPFSDSCAMSNSPPQNGNTQKWKSKIVILWDKYWSHFTLCRHWIPAFSLTNHQKNFDSDNTWLWPSFLGQSFLWSSFWWKTLIVTTGLKIHFKGQPFSFRGCWDLMSSSKEYYFTINRNTKMSLKDQKKCFRNKLTFWPINHFLSVLLTHCIRRVFWVKLFTAIFQPIHSFFLKKPEFYFVFAK